MAQPANRGEDFDDPDVAAAYVHRVPYPAELLETLIDLAPARRRVLDLGSGPGKLARSLAPAFGEVWAVDPSQPMLGLGQRLDDGAHPNIRWILSTGEALDAEPGAFDLAAAGASIHWMQPAIVFPKLARWLAPGGQIAIVEGDGPAEAPWRAGYLAIIQGWVARLGGEWNDPQTLARGRAHLPWIGEPTWRAFDHPARLRVEDFIEGEHSRATWSRAKMGAAAAAQFDDDLRRLLEPHAADGWLTYTVRTQLLYGRPLSEPSG